MLATFHLMQKTIQVQCTPASFSTFPSPLLTLEQSTQLVILYVNASPAENPETLSTCSSEAPSKRCLFRFEVLKSLIATYKNNHKDRAFGIPWEKSQNYARNLTKLHTKLISWKMTDYEVNYT